MANEATFRPNPTCTPRVGMITQWEDDKGYGWVESGEQQFFAHIKDFDRGQRRPKVGEEVRFFPGMDPKGRTCARRATFVKAGPCRSGFARAGLGTWGLLGFLLVLPLSALLWLPLPWWMGAGVMLGVSVITYLMYLHDKNQAVSKGWRVAESSLHLGELLGGWPGAFLAQRQLRHKCSKPGYQLVFWLIVLLYQIAAVDVMLDQRLSRTVVEFISR